MNSSSSLRRGSPLCAIAPTALEEPQQGRARQLAQAFEVERAHLRKEALHVFAAEREHAEALLVAQGHMGDRAHVRGAFAEPGRRLGQAARAAIGLRERSGVALELRAYGTELRRLLFAPMSVAPGAPDPE